MHGDYMQGGNDSAWKLYLSFEPDGHKTPMAQLPIGPTTVTLDGTLGRKVEQWHIYPINEASSWICVDEHAKELLAMPGQWCLDWFAVSAPHCLCKVASPDSGLLPCRWLIEAPHVLMNGQLPLLALKALILSRWTLVDYAVLCLLILMVQILASSWYEACYCQHWSIPKGKWGSVPHSEMHCTCEGASGVSLGKVKGNWDINTMPLRANDL
ncbi:hypothetical protein EDC04DRAFT_2608342 [Pisolithus marmoratus]|nr:hypothetical protein EDC04DRAFT_2608342 [Pisolithus marmoratus]